MASESGTLYLGMTNNLSRRVWEHKNDMVEGFTKEYECHKLIYFEQMPDVNSAIRREKEIKKWRREKKINLIRTTNPGWRDLYDDYTKVRELENIERDFSSFQSSK